MGKKEGAMSLLFFVVVFLVTGCVGFQETSTTPVPSGYPISPIQVENVPTATALAQSPIPTVSISPTPTATLSSLPTVSLSSSIRESIPTSRQVLEAMYGDEALSISDTEVLLPAPVPNYTTTVHINLMACFREGPDEKCLVVTDGAFDNCHICQSEIDCAMFQVVNGSWELVVFQPNVISLGSFGYVPKGELIQIGPDKHAALIRSGWAGQGYEGEHATIIAEIDGSFRVVLNISVGALQESFEKDGTTPLMWGYGSKMEFFADDDHPDYYILLMTQYGINEEGEKFKTVSLYAFSDTEGQYVMVSQR